MCAELGEYTYNYSGPGQGERYTQTTKKIAEHVGQEYKLGSIIRTAIETLSTCSISTSDDPNHNYNLFTIPYCRRINIKIVIIIIKIQSAILAKQFLSTQFFKFHFMRFIF